MGMAVFMVVSSTLQRAHLCVVELVRPSFITQRWVGMVEVEKAIFSGFLVPNYLIFLKKLGTVYQKT